MAQAAPNHAPAFVNGTTQNFGVCENAGAVTLSTVLAIIDSDSGQTETWFVTAAPLHGTLAGFSTTATSTGSNVLPLGLTYAPAAGYIGADTFAVTVTDGIAVATTTVYVTVHGLPTLGSSLTPPAICDGSVFSYTPGSATPGATFHWHRTLVAGISNPTASGIGNPDETLVNTTSYDVAANYAYTVIANGCSTTEHVIVTVHPTPRLSSVLYDTICSGSTFAYAPVVATAGTTYTWTRAVVAGITPAVASSGTGNINETLTNTTTTPLNTVYSFALSANGCNATRNLTVSVIPGVAGIPITTMSPSSVCAGTMYQNFGAATPPPVGVTFAWNTVNATLYAVGSTNQYAIVNFPNAGNAWVTLTQSFGSANCVRNDSFKVTVGASSPASANVIYYGYQFVYTDNTADAYQWGYDNTSTLDSTIIDGATFQSYVNALPDFANNFYWVMVTKGGCTQKIYYNGPLSVTNMQLGVGQGLKVYPNPASNTLNININAPQGSVTDIVLTDMPGQTINKVTTSGHTAQFDIAALPAGCYMLSCWQDGVKVATTRFIKN